MNENIKQASRNGLLFGIILCFVILFGLTTTLSEILGDLFTPAVTFCSSWISNPSTGRVLL